MIEDLIRRRTENRLLPEQVELSNSLDLLNEIGHSEEVDLDRRTRNGYV